MRFIFSVSFALIYLEPAQGSATLSMAYAAALFADSCLRGLNGIPTVECTYVESTVTDAPYFASKVKLSTEGKRSHLWEVEGMCLSVSGTLFLVFWNCFIGLFLRSLF